MAAAEPRIIGRYALHGEIASGGMATVHLGRLLGQVGFSRTVAIKRLHPQFAKDLDFVAMFLEEARLAARIQHPNVVQTLDVEASSDELLLVLEFVLGESLARLIRASYQASVALPIPVILGILANALDGLHAAHEARSEQGEPLGIVHRDVSPQNILVGADGVARVLDFGIAKATRRSEQTRSGMLKGKVAYMPPEQLKGGGIDRRTDIYAASVVLWETLTGYRLFDGEDDFQVAHKILSEEPPPPSRYRQDIPPALDAVVLQGLARDPKDRYPSALDMIAALEAVVPLASSREIARWIDRIAGASLRQRSELIAEVERQTEPTTPDRASLLRIPASAPRPSVVQPRPPTSPPRPSFVSSRPSFLRSPGDPSAQRTPLPASQGTRVPVPPPPAPRPPASSLAPVPAPLSLRRPPSSPRLSEPPPAPPLEEPPTLPPPAPTAELAAHPPAPAPPLEPPPESLPGTPPEAPTEPPPELPADPLPEAEVHPPAPVEAAAGVAQLAPEATVAQAPLAELLAAANLSRAPEVTDDPPGASRVTDDPPGASEVAANLSGGPEPGGSSQISGVSIIRPPSLRSPPPGLRWGLLGAAALLLLGVGVWLRSSGAEPKKTAPEVASPVDAVASGSAEPAPSVVEPPPEPAPSPVASAEPSAGVVSDPPPPPSTKPAVKAPATPRKNNCNPPYTIDKKGIKRIKPECA
jgi:serine/threonine-protein kinase